MTAHPGQELFPKFSPDGKWIAFTGQYEGDEQVYVVPSDGGVPKRLTWYPARGPLPPRGGMDNQVYGWTPDGAKVLFRSLRDAESAKVESALYTVPVTGGLPAKLPMYTAGAGDFSPDGTKLVYSPLFRDFRTWKRYEGGWAQDLFVYDLASGTLEGHRPVEADRARSDVDRREDLLRLRPGRHAEPLLGRPVGRRPRKADAVDDVGRPLGELGFGAGRIVYELGGELRLYDVKAKTDTALAITVPSDGLASRPSRVSAEKRIESFSLSPKGERALFVARGDVFTAPIEKGPTRNLTRSSNAHDKHATWSPDGKTIAYVSDRTGEEQIWLAAQDGSGKPEQLTTTFGSMLTAPAWSPDGARLALADKDGKLYVVTVAGKKVVEIADDRFGGIFDYAWSPDGAHLAFSMGEHTGMRVLHVWSVADGKVRRVTSELFSSSSPAWDPEGKLLYFLSNREFAPADLRHRVELRGQPQDRHLRPRPPEGRREPLRARERRGERGRREGREEGRRQEGRRRRRKDAADTKKGDAKDAKKDAAKAPKPVVIEWDGLASRVVRVPVEADNLDGLAVTKTALLYAKEGAAFYGRDSDRKTSLAIYDLKEREETELVADVDGWAVSDDGKKVLVRGGGKEKGFKLWDVKPKAKDPKSVSTKELVVDRVPAEEWATIFDEVWRRYRDFFYVRNMHGYDWKAIGDALPAAPAARLPPLRPDLPPRRDGRRAERRARLHRGGGHRAPGAGEGGPPRRALRARREGRALPHRDDLPRPQRGGEVPLAAHGGRRRRPRRRLRPRRRRRRADGETTTPTASSSTRPTPSPSR